MLYDPFNGTSLGSAWTVTTGTYSVNNQLIVHMADTRALMWNSTSITSANQYALVTFVYDATTDYEYIKPLFRVTNANSSCYGVLIGRIASN